MIRQLENGKKKADVCRKVGLVNLTIEIICKIKIQIISAFEQNGSTVTLFRKPERSDVNEALLRWFQLRQKWQYTVPVRGPLLMITFVLPEL